MRKPTLSISKHPLLIATIFFIIVTFSFIIIDRNTFTKVLLLTHLGVRSTSSNNYVAGTRVNLEFYLSNLLPTVENARFIYTTKTGSSGNLNMQLNNNVISVKLPTLEDDKEITYSIELEIDQQTFHYPLNGNTTLQLSKTAIADPPDFVYEEISFSELNPGEKNIFRINIPDNFPISQAQLRYKLNSTEKYSRQDLDYEQSFRTEVELPKLMSKISYHFAFKAGGKIYRYPAEQDIILLNPDIEAFIENLNNEYVAKSDNLHFSFSDKYGNLISSRGDESVGSVSVIKVLVMIETFKQLQEGMISLKDTVDQYGYIGTVESALGHMMGVSSNEATGALVEKVGGVDNINATFRSYIGENPISYIESTPGYSRFEGSKIGNKLTTNEFTKLMQLLEAGKIIDTETSAQMLALMEKCSDYFNVRNIEGIEKIAMKTGYYPYLIFGLSGVVYLEDGDSLAFTIFFDNWEDRNNVEIGAIAAVLEKIIEFYDNDYQLTDRLSGTS